MAVNDNDRVTSRRLKQFWDIAKQWIQTLVSGAIDTSEAAMESSMDTKIQAAKPNYNMPNTNDQIGVGLGYNDVNIEIQALLGNSNKIALMNRFKALPYPMNTALVSALNNAQQAATAAPDFKKAYLKYMQGKMVVFPAQMDLTPTENNPQFKEWIKSTYSEENGKPYLTSPVYHYTESGTAHTIQTRLTHHSSGDNLAIEHKIDDGVWSSSGMNGFLIAIHSLQNGMFAIGAGTIPNGSITQQHFMNSSVTSTAIASKAVTLAKVATDLRTRTLNHREKEVTVASEPLLVQLITHSPNNDTSDILGVSFTIIGGWNAFVSCCRNVSNNIYPFMFNGDGTLNMGACSFANKKGDLSYLNGIAWMKTDNGTYTSPFIAYNDGSTKVDIEFLDQNFTSHGSENNATISISTNLTLFNTALD